MEEDVTLDPMDVCLLSPPAVVACANGETDTVEELRLRRLGRGGFANDGGRRRALEEDAVADRSYCGPNVHRGPPGCADDSLGGARTASTIVPTAETVREKILSSRRRLVLLCQ